MEVSSCIIRISHYDTSMLRWHAFRSLLVGQTESADSGVCVLDMSLVLKNSAVVGWLPVLPPLSMRFSSGYVRPPERRAATGARACEPVRGHFANITGCEEARHMVILLTSLGVRRLGTWSFC